MKPINTFNKHHHLSIRVLITLTPQHHGSNPGNQ